MYLTEAQQNLMDIADGIIIAASKSVAMEIRYQIVMEINQIAEGFDKDEFIRHDLDEELVFTEMVVEASK